MRASITTTSTASTFKRLPQITRSSPCNICFSLYLMLTDVNQINTVIQSRYNQNIFYWLAPDP
jgi:hypothetical protein